MFDCDRLHCNDTIGRCNRCPLDRRDMSLDELRKAEARYVRALARAEEARLERNRLVFAALGAGVTHAQIAETTGLTRGRIGQLAQEWKERGAE